MGQQAACCSRNGTANALIAENAVSGDGSDQVAAAGDDALYADEATSSRRQKRRQALSMDAVTEKDIAHLLNDEDLAYLAAAETPAGGVAGGAGFDRQVSEEFVKKQTADNVTNENIGDHICPMLGAEATKNFMSKHRLTKLLEASKEDMGKDFSLDSKSVADSGVSGDTGNVGIAMAVSDPLAEDCPLVFVSSGFEDLTGYTSEFVVGRSCRFLQPTSKVLNDGVNLNDRKMMRSFCTEIQPEGTTILNLLLNERRTGGRFWNLLRMQYVKVDGQEYIFGVQCTLDGYMPKLLNRRLLGSDKNAGIVGALGEFLHALENIRAEIRKKEFVPILELKGYYTCALNMLQMLPALTTLSPSTPGSNSITALVKDGGADDKPEPIAPGSMVTIKEELKYPTYKVPPNSEGKILSIDSFGTATIDWKGIGKKGCLKRDLPKLMVKR